MIIFEHRINSIAALEKVPLSRGVEFDVRLNHGSLVTAHSPFEPGDSLVDFLKFVGGRPLIVNIKEEGIEDLVIKLLGENDVLNYFLLDVSFPYLIKFAQQGFTRIATRASEFEDSKALQMTGSDWCWLDSFGDDFGHCVETIKLANEVGSKVCLVSPELHDLGRVNLVSDLQQLLKIHGLRLDGVCTKYPDLWL